MFGFIADSDTVQGINDNGSGTIGLLEILIKLAGFKV
jgi:Zn-dependent M28 family amino/carboxypeptidase